ncbi:lambda light chain variable region, partial [Podarcis lilfordi]
MALSPCHLLILVFAYYSGSVAQYVLNQPPSVSVSLGQTAEFSCSGERVDKHYVYWYQQKPGGIPKAVIYKDKERPAGIPERFSGRSSGKTVTLIIAGVQQQDEADYYCQGWDNVTASQHSGVFRGGSKTQTFGPQRQLQLPHLTGSQ